MAATLGANGKVSQTGSPPETGAVTREPAQPRNQARERAQEAPVEERSELSPPTVRTPLTPVRFLPVTAPNHLGVPVLAMTKSL